VFDYPYACVLSICFGLFVFQVSPEGSEILQACRCRSSTAFIDRYGFGPKSLVRSLRADGRPTPGGIRERTSAKWFPSISFHAWQGLSFKPRRVEASGEANGDGGRVTDFKADGHPSRTDAMHRAKVVVVLHSWWFVRMTGYRFQKMLLNSPDHHGRRKLAPLWGVNLMNLKESSPGAAAG